MSSKMCFRYEGRFKKVVPVFYFQIKEGRRTIDLGRQERKYTRGLIIILSSLDLILFYVTVTNGLISYAFVFTNTRFSF